MNGTLRSWQHYIELREKEGTQKEHREIAEECVREIRKLVGNEWFEGTNGSREP
jgi:thymidylate synthase ThyX